MWRFLPVHILLQIYAYGSWALIPILVLAAWAWGGRPEQVASWMYLVAAVASRLVRPISADAFVHLEWATLVIDGLLMVGLIGLALRSDRFWPLPSAALQVVSCLAHIEKMIEPRSYTLGYQMLAQASTYPTLLLLGLGILRQWRRSRPERRYLDCSPLQDCPPPTR